MVHIDKLGGRTVELLIPFEWQGRKIEEISFAPVRYDHSMRWSKGEYKSLNGLMAELAGMSEETLRQIRHPDFDRVMTEFMIHLPEDIRAWTSRGEVPTKVALSDMSVEEQPNEEEPAPEDLGGFDLDDR